MMLKEQREYIKTILISCLRGKFQHYTPESKVMPFHTRLLGNDRMALFSFIQSLNTSFGSSIFEPVATALAQSNFAEVERQKVVGTQISRDAAIVIEDIMRDLKAAARSPLKDNEIAVIRKAAGQGEMVNIKPTKADLYLKTKSGVFYFFDLKSAKPNKGEFEGFKRTLLEWTAVWLAKNPKADVFSVIAIPYNPYEPEPYARWTMAGMLDLSKELMVAQEFWNFLGADEVYEDLLDCFKQVGIDLKQEIDDYFAKFNLKNYD
ncbi:MAG: TdeIII family type II restriction endonuclease [Deferribacteraceae bacterium]|jgi:type II restriction enzyme|nr:TdeIII family type II restriction endonuclease [Deferribacteraceae bacterium]